MEYLFLAVILYFVLRTAGNLVRLLGGERASSSQDSPFREPERRESTGPRNGWQGPSPREQTDRSRGDPTFWGEDIEDATWQDLDGERSRRNAAG